jgi:hypothetical protein
LREAGCETPARLFLSRTKAAKALIGYYLDASLRAPKEKLAKLCGAP